jgi:hypothetical protein
MVKDQHPQAAKEAAANVLPAWLDAFKVLLDLDPQQDVSGENWDGLEIRIQMFRVHTELSALFSGPLTDIYGKDRPSTQYIHPFHASFSRIYQLMSLLPCTISTHFTRHTCGTISPTTCQYQIHPRVSRSSCTNLSRRSSTLCLALPAKARLASHLTRGRWRSWSTLWSSGLR